MKWASDAQRSGSPRQAGTRVRHRGCGLDLFASNNLADDLLRERQSPTFLGDSRAGSGRSRSCRLTRGRNLATSHFLWLAVFA
jgi:hypothetical protein